jgi:5-hydroxyisourate hydrolase
MSKVYTLLNRLKTIQCLPQPHTFITKAMGQLTTHVLDTMNGCPAAGLWVSLYRLQDEAAALIKTIQLNEDGRSNEKLLEHQAFEAGRYRLVFRVGDYFRARGAALPTPAFLETVPIDFGVADASQHYHVPLLASPWSYSTYRGS